MRQQKRPRVRGLFIILEMQTFVRLLPKSPAKEGPRGALGSRGAFPLWALDLGICEMQVLRVSGIMSMRVWDKF